MKGHGSVHPSSITRLLGVSALLLGASNVCAVFGGEFHVERLNGGRPIVSRQSFVNAGTEFAQQGENINGPSMIRVPDWITPDARADPKARYYLYFAHHQGAFIRMAWASNVDGPYTLFGQYPLATRTPRGVLDLGPDRRTSLGNELELRDHVASPDVHVNQQGRRIEMYFHGPASHNGSGIGQKSFVAFSDTGLDFHDRVVPVVLGFAYFRVFDLAGQKYAVASRGALYQARNPAEPFTPPASFDYSKELWLPEGRHPSDNAFQRAIDMAKAERQLPAHVERARHFAVDVTDGQCLAFFYTRVADAPERILMSTLESPPADFTQWKSSFPPKEVLRPEHEWEGASKPNVASRAGKAGGLVHQLRDPYVFRAADGRHYLLYSGGGEEGIGIAEIKWEPEVISEETIHHLPKQYSNVRETPLTVDVSGENREFTFELAD